MNLAGSPTDLVVQVSCRWCSTERDATARSGDLSQKQEQKTLTA